MSTARIDSRVRSAPRLMALCGAGHETSAAEGVERQPATGPLGPAAPKTSAPSARTRSVAVPLVLLLAVHAATLTAALALALPN